MRGHPQKKKIVTHANIIISSPKMKGFGLWLTMKSKVCVLDLVQLEDDLEVQYYFRIIF